MQLGSCVRLDQDAGETGYRVEADGLAGRFGVESDAIVTRQGDAR